MRLLPAVHAAIASFVPPSQDYAIDCLKTDQARAVCALEAVLTDALREIDARKLAGIYADDFRLINFRGREIDRAGALTAIRTGTIRFDSLTTSELRLRFSESVALITGRQHQVAHESGGEDHPKDVR